MEHVTQDRLPTSGQSTDPAPGALSTSWDPVDELAAVQAAMNRLRARHAALCDMFLSPGADVRFEGRTHLVQVVAESRRTFDRRRLPPAILQDDRYYALSTHRNVRLVAKDGALPDDDAVVEPFH